MKISNEDIDNSMFAPCGMNCKVCYKHCYSKNICEGCFSKSKNKLNHCKTCKIKSCTEDKRIKYCFECSDYPCILIKRLDKNYIKKYDVSLIENSRFVEKYGIKSFLKSEKEKYTCKYCEGIISIHDKKCSECEEEIK